MYLNGSKWSMRRRRRRLNWWLIGIVGALILAFVYIDTVLVPTTAPLFIPSPTTTRDPKSYAADAAALLEEGKINQAIEGYKLAIRAEPKNAANYIILARLQVWTSQYGEATKNIENALLMDKNNATANAIYGWVLGLQGDYLKAQAALNKALELDENHAQAHAYYAEVLILMNYADQGGMDTLDRAASESRLALELNPNIVETKRARGIVLEATANYAEALEQFKSAVELDPNIADLHMALARNYFVLDDYTSAVDEFNRAFALNPTDPMPNYYISRTYAKAGQYAKAIQYAEQAVKIRPDDALLQANLGSMFYRDSQYTNAVEHLKLAIQGGTTDEGLAVAPIKLDYDIRTIEFYSRYGLALAQINDCTEAIRVAQAILEGLKDDETAVYNANEMIRICKENIEGTATPTKPALTATPEP
jgi:tetratricopeptide (TPR) repeat protein